MATVKEVLADIDFLAQPVKESDGKISQTVPQTIHAPYKITKTGSKVNARALVEYLVRKYGLDAKNVRNLDLTNDKDKLHLGIKVTEWKNLIGSIPEGFIINQLPLIIEGKEVEIKDEAQGAKSLKDLEAKIDQSKVKSLGDLIDSARTMTGEEPATNNMIARIGLGVLCVGGIALLVHHSRKSIS